MRFPASPELRRTLRYALGITLAGALAFAVAWPLAVMFPVLSAVMLALPLPRLRLPQALSLVRQAILAFAISLAIAEFFLPIPLLFVAALFFTLFHAYYYHNRGGSFLFVLMLLTSLCLLPLLATSHDGLAIGMAAGLLVSFVLTIILMYLVHIFVPDLPDTPYPPAPPPYQPGYQPSAAFDALKSTLVMFPLILLFIAANWSGQMLVLVFAATFSLSADIDMSRQAGIEALQSTIIAGAVAFVLYWLIAAVPEYYFILPLLLLVSLHFGKAIFITAGPKAKTLPSAMVTTIILLNSSLGGSSSLTETLVGRIVLIMLAATYVVTALGVYTRLWPDKNRVIPENQGL